MDYQITMTGLVAAYVFMLAAFSGWVIIGRVPAILHTPLMSGSNFVHGIVVVGGLFVLLNATSTVQELVGFVAVLLGAGNVAGGFIVTHRMLAMFQTTHARPASARAKGPSKSGGPPKAPAKPRAKRAPKAAAGAAAAAAAAESTDGAAPAGEPVKPRRRTKKG